MGADDRLFGAALFQFALLALALALLLPVMPAVAEGEEPGKASGCPDLDGRERESGGQIECDGKNGDADDIRAGDVQVVNERIADDASGEAFDGDRVHPVQMTGQNGQERGDEHEKPECAERLGDRGLNGARAEPADSEHAEENGQQERADAEELENDIGEIGAENADPVAGGARSGEGRGAVERGIERGIGSQREEKKERGDAQQKADEFVESAVSAGSEDFRKKFHLAAPERGGGWISHSAGNLARAC